MSKRKKLEEKLREKRAAWWKRWTNTMLITALTPVLLLITVYLLLFFILNSSYGPKIFHAQLSQFLRGDYYADTLSTDALLRTLTLTNVRLSEAGKTDAVVWAPKLEAKIPVEELVYLITDTTLKLGRIKVYDAEVTLDFSHGELNILKVVLPYFSEPKPPSPPGNFVTYLSDLNVEHTNVHLIFDGFRIDLYNTDVDHYELRAASELVMRSPSFKANENRYAVRVGHGTIDFNPALFSFALSSMGDSTEALILSGGSQSAGKLAYADAMSARWLATLLQNTGQFKTLPIVMPDTRGHYIIELKDTVVDAFNWRGNTMKIPAMATQLGNHAHISMKNAMMNVGPTQADIDAMTEQYRHTPSGLLPEESILWAVDGFDLEMRVDDPVLTYFVGDILSGDIPFHLSAQMRGDLARVSGDISLDLKSAETFGVDIDRLALRASLDGQRAEIHALEADTHLGAVAISGFYEIMDGNFDINLWGGTSPKDGEFPTLANTFKARLNEGMTPLDFFQDGPIKRFSGILKTQIHAKSQNGRISVSMPQPLSYKFDDPAYGIDKLTVAPETSKDPTVFVMDGSVISSPAGLNIKAASDAIKLKPGFQFDLKNPLAANADLTIHISQPALYTAAVGIENLKSDPLDIHAAYSRCNEKLCGNVTLQTGGINYNGIEIQNIDIDLALKDSKLKTNRFDIQTNLIRLNADLRAALSPDSIHKPLDIPFEGNVHFSDIALETLPWDAVMAFIPSVESIVNLGLKGHGEGDLNASGPLRQLKAAVSLEIQDVEALEIQASHLSFFAKYEDHKIFVPSLNLWFSSPHPTIATESEPQGHENHSGQNSRDKSAIADNSAPASPYRPSRRFKRPDFSINTLTYDIAQNTLALRVRLSPTSPNAFKPIQKLNLPLEGTIDWDLSANLDINWLLYIMQPTGKAPKSYQPTWIEGAVDFNQIRYDGLNLGNTQIRFSRSQQYALVKGNIIDLIDLVGFVRTAPTLSASIALNFPDLNVLNALDDIGIDVSSLVESFKIKDAQIAGSIGLCIKNLQDIKLSILLDNIAASVLGYDLTLSQPAFIRADLNRMSVSLNALELKYRDSVLKLSLKGDLDGNVELDLNGEIDAALTRSFVPAIKKSSGLLAVNLSAHGNVYDHSKLSLNNLNLEGYLGVRDTIQIGTELSEYPIEMPKGFIRIDRKHPNCARGEICLYTPDDQPFTIGINNQWITLELFTGTRGKFQAHLNGILNATVAQLFVKDISNAKGSIELEANAATSFIDKQGTFLFDPAKLDINGRIEVTDPIDIEMHSLNTPITIQDGLIQITEGNDCPGQSQCIVIPKNRAFSGNIMGGSYLIFGEIARDAIMPKSANLSITANNVGYRLKDELSLSISPDIQIIAKDFSNFETIKVAGDIQIAEARYHKNFDDGTSNFVKEQILSMFVNSKKRAATYSPSFLRKMPDLGKIQFDINVNAENSINADVQIAGATVKLELGAQAKIGGTITDIAPTGIVSINSGLFSMNNNDFDFQSGSQIAFNGSLDGKLDITASAEISTDSNAFSAVTGSTDLDKRKRISSNSNNTAGDLYAITLTVGGSVFAPTWNFESSPYLSDANVYALILTGKTIDDFSGNDIAMESLLSPFFSSQLDNFINADQFKFLFTQGAAQFVYVKQITKALRIAAGVSIRGSEGNEQALSGEYYFNDNWYVDLTGQNTADEEGKAPTFKLGARLHWRLVLE